MSRFVAGLDLGQATDYTALAIMEVVKDEKSSLDRLIRFPLSLDEDRKPEYHLRYLDRVRQVPYPAQVRQVAELMRREPLSGRVDLVIDATGCGRPVFDLFRQAVSCPVIPVTITGGNQEIHERGEYRVPKVDLMGAVQAVGDTGRLKYSPFLPFADILDRELLSFRVKITDSAHASYGCWREGEHDDLVLAVALALWYGERPGPQIFFV